MKLHKVNYKSFLITLILTSVLLTVWLYVFYVYNTIPKNELWCVFVPLSLFSILGLIPILIYFFKSPILFILYKDRIVINNIISKKMFIVDEIDHISTNRKEGLDLIINMKDGTKYEYRLINKSIVDSIISMTKKNT